MVIEMAAYIIFPACSVNDTRKLAIDVNSRFSQKKLRLMPPNEVCAICPVEKRIIAEGNSFDFIIAESD